MDHGKYTGELGLKLYHKYKDSNYEVFYDHGKKGDPNHCKPSAYFGEYSNSTKLSEVDIVIVDNATQSVKLLIEVEESGSSPKKTIGIITNLLIAERIRIMKDDYPLDDVSLLFAVGIKTDKGGKAKQIDLICERLRRINDECGLKNLNLTTIIDTNLERLNERVESTVEELLVK